MYERRDVGRPQYHQDHDQQVRSKEDSRICVQGISRSRGRGLEGDRGFQKQKGSLGDLKHESCEIYHVYRYRKCPVG
ncbi:hypothetical protein MT325_m094L [Paramecium bursaria chlorella virus MT325]|uniref:Uncharacterized protein m094L n=1 Tax=Paramecium bursaria Chlorella virus MT325 TaxID=346932 RepID=A7ITH4_PBCVM|nr:hypothetical protein MT325_m094L [Paramecium bursaria chlorella virus MT325]